MNEGVIRATWTVGVLLGGLALGRGLLLTTYLELTPQAQADAEQGRWWLWVSTIVLLALAWLAFRRWRMSVWPPLAVAAAGPVCLTVESQGWIPLIAAPAIVLLLLVGIPGVLLAPRR